VGLFGGLFKAIGKVAGGALKAVASKATGGLSDTVLKALKQRGEAKRIAKANAYSLQQLAAVEKLRPLQPSVVRPARVLRDALSGQPGEWNEADEAPRPRKRMPGRRKAAVAAMEDEPAPRKRSRRPAKARTARKTGTRRPPSGGLDLKAIGALYREQGKPGGNWKAFVKAHSDMRL
jgi:hypothetical protein